MSDDRQSRQGPPAVEPLGDLQWARIERAVYAELDAEVPRLDTPVRSRKTPWLVAAGAAAVIVVVAASSSSSTPPATAVAARDAGAAPQWVVTEGGPSNVTFGDARIRVAPRSAIVMNGTPDDGVLIVLDRGGADFEVAPRQGRPRFMVQAGEVSVRVIGTAFHVERVGDRARVSVEHGVVEVVAPGETAQVHAGEVWPTEVASSQQTTTEPIDVEMAPVDVDRDRPKHHAQAPADAVQQAQPLPDNNTATAGPDDAHRFAAATAIEAGNPAAALTEYRKLAAGDGPWAANALYAAARLYAERHDKAAARAAAEEYLHRFPRGVNAADARSLLDRL